MGKKGASCLPEYLGNVIGGFIFYTSSCTVKSVHADCISTSIQKGCCQWCAGKSALYKENHSYDFDGVNTPAMVHFKLPMA